MSENGIKTTNIGKVSIVDSLLGNKDGTTQIVPIGDLSRQISAILEIEDLGVNAAIAAAVRSEAALDASLAVAATLGATPYATKSTMDGVTPGSLPASAYVYADGVLSNNGLYFYASGGSAWVKDVLDINDRTTLIEQTALITGEYETMVTDDGIVFTDADGNGSIIRYGDPDTGDSAEVTSARGDATSLNQRISRGLTPYGDVLGPSLNEWKLRNARRKLRLLQQGYSTQLVINAFGDSWVEGPYVSPYLAKALHDAYGIAGLGWVGFQHFASNAATAFVDPGTQPLGGTQGNARNDLVTGPILQGTWSNDNGQGGVSNPSIGGISSSEVGAYARFSWTGAAHNAADLHYYGDGTGVIRYSWNDGSTWESNLMLSTSGPALLALGNVTTATSGSLRVEVVSGNVSLAGVYMKSPASGVRFNVIAASGSRADQYVATGPDAWAARVATLAADMTMGMLATNDQGINNVGIPPATFAGYIEQLLTALEAAQPTMDILWLCPFENVRVGGQPYPMNEFSAAVRSIVAANGWALLDTQYAAGNDPDDYEFGSTLEPAGFQQWTPQQA